MVRLVFTVRGKKGKQNESSLTNKLCVGGLIKAGTVMLQYIKTYYLEPISDLRMHIQYFSLCLIK